MGQDNELARVSETISSTILEFMKEKKSRGLRIFYCEDLRRFVTGRHKVAPASPDRVLRMLRRKGALNYRIVDRAASCYEFLPISGRGR